MRETEVLGLTTELQCQLAFTKLNIVLSKPITADSKYDFIADINNHLYRIQCKTSILSEDMNSIIFSCKSSGRGANGKNYSITYTKDDIDFFYTCYNNVSYLIPIEECSGETKVLRFESKLKSKKIAWAKDFELHDFLSIHFNYIYDESFIDNHKRLNNAELNHCVDCGAVISKNATRCNACDHKRSRIAVRPEREQLKYMIRHMTFTAIGQIYGISANAIIKWCKAVGLPFTKKDIETYTDEQWEAL